MIALSSGLSFTVLVDRGRGGHVVQAMARSDMK